MAGGAVRFCMAPRGNNTQPDAPIKRGPAYPRSVDTLIAQFASLPGIGRRSAERLAFHVLKSDTPTAEALANAILDVKRQVRHCSVCWNLSDASLCDVCADDRRDRRTVLVVEQPRDLVALEQTSMFRGIYHVLMGRLSPLDGIGAGDLTVAGLVDRIDHPEKNAGGEPVAEVILGLNPTIEGDGTAMYLSDMLKERPVKVTRLARGLPTGSQLEYANKAVLTDAIQSRQTF
jgi:recombination protein RecR